MDENREQRLIDICFAVAIAAREFQGESNEEIAAWVAQQLSLCGFQTVPMGMSWGVLVNEEKV